MSDIETALSFVEDYLSKVNGSCKFIKTASPDVFCTSLPNHWRSNKSLPNPFMVLVLAPVEDGTRVTVSAGNEENCAADVKNNVTEIHQQVAKFSDLRFVGKSGRGKNFNLTITIHREGSHEVAIASSIIKVTVDGPRDSRNANKFSHPFDFRKRPMGIYPSIASMNLPSSSNTNLFDLHTAKRPKLDIPMQQPINPLIQSPLEMFQYPILPFISPMSNQFRLILAYYQTILQKASSISETNEKAINHVDEKKVWRPFS
ncbi:hypothetical protein FO519_003888 [Halicephalobus sp. NKZ332]|nr:hypothetical protein FO519_003888 [Halicephalobus sp. NKZ332]